MKRVAFHAAVVISCILVTYNSAFSQTTRQLRVHLAQANNDSPYTLVRAKFEPGELADPWAVRFFDDKGGEIPYFVWDSVTWGVARKGRADWGERYALVNHAAGDTAEVKGARAKKLEWARKLLPEPGLGDRLDFQELAAFRKPDSVCAAMYLLRHRVAPLAKDQLTLKFYATKQEEPKHRVWKAVDSDERPAGPAEPLQLQGLPDKLRVLWKGKEIFRCAGFQAGGTTDTVSHADPSRPVRVETWDGIITKVAITGHTKGRQGGTMDWQSTYWLFKEGTFVGLHGFSLSDTTGYIGGPQKITIWQADGDFVNQNMPSWDKPWWLYQAGEGKFVATHLFQATPLTIGYGNNPFTVNAEGLDKDPKVWADGKRLSLTWTHSINDPAIARVMAPQPLMKNPPPKAKLAWQPRIDWLYRQYAAGVGETGDAAEKALRTVLSAAAGWIDRPFTEEQIAALLVAQMPRIATGRESSEIGLLKIVPAVLSGDKSAINTAMGRAKDPVSRTDFYINLVRKHVELGGRPSEGKKKDDPDGTPREGWTGNPCYHAAMMPVYVRVLEHFELPCPKKGYDDAIVRYADFSVEIMGGKPIDFDKLNAMFQTEWPSRIVPIIPLMLHANSIKPDPKYTRTAKLLFGDLMRLVERNPHGYFPVWTFKPKADRFDTVYNPVSYERGITSLWSEGGLDTVGREEASKFVAAQARWFVFSGQLLDTLETDNPTGIRAATHGGHTGIRNQIGIYLYDDFAFYRGLVGDLIAWSAAACMVPEPVDDSGTGPYRRLELSNAGSAMLRWALGIRPGSTWHESKVERLPKGGFRVQAWNRLPKEKPITKVNAADAGLKADGEVMSVQLSGPAYREPGEVEVTSSADKVSIKVSKAAKLRLNYTALRPDWTAETKLSLVRKMTAAPDVVWDAGRVEWQAAPGEYELRVAVR